MHFKYLYSECACLDINIQFGYVQSSIFLFVILFLLLQR